MICSPNEVITSDVRLRLACLPCDWNLMIIIIILLL